MTAIYVASQYAPELLGPISVATDSYMALVLIISRDHEGADDAISISEALVRRVPLPGWMFSALRVAQNVEIDDVALAEGARHDFHGCGSSLDAGR